MKLDQIYAADENAPRGIVYFLECGGDDAVKVGYTTHLWKRIGDLRTSSAKPLTLMDYVRADKRVEKALHLALKSERLTGEWFKASDKTLDLLYMVSDFIETFDDNDEDTDGRDAHVLTLDELQEVMARPYHWAIDYWVDDE
jgi:hypothetical protein